MKPDRHVLMISIGENLLRNPMGDPIARHQAYASRIGKISMVLYTGRKGHRVSSYQDNFYIYPTNSLSKLNFIFDAFRLSKSIIRREKVDLITTQDPFGTGLVGVWLKKKFGIPLEIQNHSNFIDNFDWINEKPLFFRFLNLLAKRFVLPRGNRFRVLNTQELKIYKQNGFSEKLIQIIPTPVNLNNFLDFRISETDRRRINESHKINEESKVLIWVGRPVKFKKIKFLIDVFLNVQKRLNNVILMLVGDLNLMSTRERKYLEENQEKGIIAPGQISHQDLPAYYAISDVYVHTSIYEGFGKSIVEAMASGLPVVVSQTQGPTDFIRNRENGFIIKDRNPEIFGDVIIEILNNKNLKTRISKRARTFASVHFRRDKSIDKIVNLWRNMN